MGRMARPLGRDRSVAPLNIACRLTSRAVHRPRTPMRHHHTGTIILRHWHCLPTDCPSLRGRMPAPETGSMEARQRLLTRFTPRPHSFGFLAESPSNPNHCSPSLTSSRRARPRLHKTRIPPARPSSRQCPPPRIGLLPMLHGEASSHRHSRGHHQGTV